MLRRSKRVKSSREEDATATNNVGVERRQDVDGQDKAYEPDLGALSSDASDFEKHRPKTLARKKSASARSRPRKAGKLRHMLDMPLDVILEICAHLQPKDILNLSRASKNLRKFFMSRNSAPIWKTALSNVSILPTCPGDLSEPAYVDLMFGSHCYSCAKKNCKDVYWLSRVRLCEECRKIHEVYEPLDKRAKGMIQPYELTELVPPIRYLDKREEKPVFYVPELTDFLKNLNKTPARERGEFLWKQAELIEARQYGNYKLTSALRSLRESRTNELQNQRDARRNAIVARLKEAGHGADIEYLLNEYLGDERRQFIMMPEVRKTQRLTDKSWNSMKDKILVILESVTGERLAAARKATTLHRLGEIDRLVKEAVSTLRGRKPCTAEIVYHIPEIAQVIDPVHDEFDVQELERVLNEVIPTYLEDHEKHLLQEFGAFITGLLGLDAATDPYKLAATMWYPCAGCSQIHNFDTVLHHACNWVCEAGSGPPGAMSDEVYRNFTHWVWHVKQHVPQSPWWKYRQGIEAAAALIEKAGFDPKKATVNDIDHANVRIVQLGSGYYTTIMSWRAALIRAYKKQWYTGYRKATEAEIAAAKPLEAVREFQETRVPRSDYQCGRCDDLARTTEDVVHKHLEETHGIVRPSHYDCLDRRPGLLPSIEVYLFCPEKTSAHSESWFVSNALEKGFGAYFHGWGDEAAAS